MLRCGGHVVAVRQLISINLGNIESMSNKWTANPVLPMSKLNFGLQNSMSNKELSEERKLDAGALLTSRSSRQMFRSLLSRFDVASSRKNNEYGEGTENATFLSLRGETYEPRRRTVRHGNCLRTRGVVFRKGYSTNRATTQKKHA